MVGGPGGIRTPDLVNAIHTRSQLRHRPISESNYRYITLRCQWNLKVWECQLFGYTIIFARSFNKKR